MAKITNIQIEYLNIDELTPYSKNTRRHGVEDVKKIAKSIAKHGMCDPVAVWGKNNIIVEGHGRLAACKSLGIETIPVIRLDEMTDKQRREYAIAHNRTAEFSEWDFDMLKEEAKELDFSDFDFDLTEEEDTEIIEDDATEIDEDTPPLSKLGDIWKLGTHRLMCGDSTNVEDVLKLMGGDIADICFTSPPYNAGSLDIKGQDGTKRKYNCYDDNKTASEYFEFLCNNVRLMLDNAKEVFTI